MYLPLKLWNNLVVALLTMSQAPDAEPPHVLAASQPCVQELGAGAAIAQLSTDVGGDSTNRPVATCCLPKAVCCVPSSAFPVLQLEELPKFQPLSFQILIAGDSNIPVTQ